MSRDVAASCFESAVRWLISEAHAAAMIFLLFESFYIMELVNRDILKIRAARSVKQCTSEAR